MHRFSKLNSRNVSNPIKNQSKIDCPPERIKMANKYMKTHITGLGEDGVVIAMPATQDEHVTLDLQCLLP